MAAAVTIVDRITSLLPSLCTQVQRYNITNVSFGVLPVCVCVCSRARGKWHHILRMFVRAAVQKVNVLAVSVDRMVIFRHLAPARPLEDGRCDVGGPAKPSSRGRQRSASDRVRSTALSPVTRPPSPPAPWWIAPDARSTASASAAGHLQSRPVGRRYSAIG